MCIYNCACRFARRFVLRPVLHLVRLAAVGDSAASAAFLVLAGVHFARGARRQRAAVQPLGRRRCCSDSRCRLIFAFGRRDAFSNVALLQHAASLQPAPRGQQRRPKRLVGAEHILFGGILYHLDEQAL